MADLIVSANHFSSLTRDRPLLFLSRLWASKHPGKRKKRSKSVNCKFSATRSGYS